MTGPLSYFITVLLAGFMLGLIALIVGIATWDTALIGLALAVLFVQALIVAGLFWWIDRSLKYSERWLKDAVSGRETERSLPRRDLPAEESPLRTQTREQTEERESTASSPRGLLYVSAALLLTSSLMIAYVWGSPRLAAIWLFAGLTLYLINRHFVRN